MQPFIIMILFVVHGHTIGARLIDSAPTVVLCQTVAADYIQKHDGEEPVMDGVKATPFVACIDTRPMVETLANGPKTST